MLHAALSTLSRHLRFVGPGAVAAVAYVDPGNWASGLEAGSRFGYKLLFVVLFASIIALFFQILCARVGIVTSTDLAKLIRIEILRDRPRNRWPLWARRCLLYFLYFVAEAGIIFTDLAELIGSAIAINLLSGDRIPLYGAVLLTVTDVLIILALFRKYPGNRVTTSAHIIECIIGLILLITLAVIIVLIVRLDPDWREVFLGYVPSHNVVSDGALYVSSSILGATAMPHSYYVGAKLATMERFTEDTSTDVPKDDEGNSQFYRNTFGVSRSLSFIRKHIMHSSVDLGFSLMSFAMVTNSAILIFSSAAFFFGRASQTVDKSEGVSDLFDAFGLIRQYVGAPFAYLFAVGLLLAGQTSSITVTLAGQIVSEGFIEWRTNPVLRRLITRLISIIPSFIVSIAIGRSGISVALVASQVALSLCLPFALVPILYLSSCSSDVMVVSANEPEDDMLKELPDKEPQPERSSWKATLSSMARRWNPIQHLRAADNTAIFQHDPWVDWLGYLTIILIIICNIVGIYQVAVDGP